MLVIRSNFTGISRLFLEFQIKIRCGVIEFVLSMVFAMMKLTRFQYKSQRMKLSCHWFLTLCHDLLKSCEYYVILNLVCTCVIFSKRRWDSAKSSKISARSHLPKSRLQCSLRNPLETMTIFLKWSRRQTCFSPGLRMKLITPYCVAPRPPNS